VKIEYACTGCSDSSADKAAPRPVDSVMEIPSALAHHYRRFLRDVAAPRSLFKADSGISLFHTPARDNEKNRVTRGQDRQGDILGALSPAASRYIDCFK